jgi:polysaccharide biosynthesis/export protein
MVYKKHQVVKIGYFFIILFLSSCLGYKKTLYFQGDVSTLEPPKLSQIYILKKGDVLQIKITNPDAESRQVLNEEGTTNRGGAVAYFTDYYINDSGYVELPFIGQVNVEGKTLMQADSIISIKANEYFQFAVVDVKFASFKFLALGEFKSPGQYFVSNEVCTIYEAIGIAGDASEYSNKEKVQLIRTLKDGSKMIYHINLTDYSTFNSDNYFIQPNDIIYIQPQKAKVDKQNVVYITLALSSITLIVALLGKF